MQDDKIYHFYFKNSFKKAAHYFVMWFVLFGVFLLFDFVAFYLYNYIRDETELTEDAVTIIFRIITSVFFVFKVYAFIIHCLPKKIILTEKGVKIKRNSFQRLTGGIFNDYLKYSIINSCKITDDNRPYPNYCKISETEMEHTVIIFTKLRRFVIPVEEAEEFVEEVNNRIKCNN